MLINIFSGKYDKFVDKVLYFFYFLFQFFFVLSGAYIIRCNENIYKIASYAIIIPFILIIIIDFYYFLRKKYSFIEVIFFVLIGAVLFMSFCNYKNVMVASNLVLIAAFKNNDAKKALKLYCYAVVIAFVIVILSGLFTQYKGNVTQIRYGLERVRYGLGFMYPSLGPFYFASFVLAYSMYKDNFRVFDYIIIILLDFVLFIFTDTKEPFAFVILFLILYCIINKYKNTIIFDIIGFFSVLSFIVFGMMAYILPLLHNAVNLIKLNSLLTGRLTLGLNAISKYGITLFGQTVDLESNSQLFVDSSFLSLLILNGIVVFIVCILFMTYFTYISYKTKKIAIVIVLLFIALRSTFDLGFMAIQFSPVVILFYSVLKEYFLKLRRTS